MKSGLSDEQYASEYVGNKMASAIGVETPRPAVVNITDEFLASIADHPDRQRVILKTGWAAGNQKLFGLAETRITPPFKGTVLRDAQILFALDMIGRQHDRSLDNPNAARSGEGVVAFDFQLAFSMEWEMGVTDRQRRQYAIDGNRRNPFRHSINEKTDFDAIFDQFVVFDQDWFKRVAKELPQGWRPYCTKIWKRVESEIKKRDTLKAMMLEASRDKS